MAATDSVLRQACKDLTQELRNPRLMPHTRNSCFRVFLCSHVDQMLACPAHMLLATCCITFTIGIAIGAWGCNLSYCCCMECVMTVEL